MGTNKKKGKKKKILYPSLAEGEMRHKGIYHQLDGMMSGLMLLWPAGILLLMLADWKKGKIIDLGASSAIKD